MNILEKSYGSNVNIIIIKDGKEIKKSNVHKSIKHGLAYVSEDRKEYGLVQEDSIKNNLTLANLEAVSKNSIINHGEEVVEAETLKERMNVRAPGIEQLTLNLSGGNQQKVVLGKWIFINPEILILDEPTRGIDVGAKYEIY